MLDTIREVLRTSKLDPSTLEFEITENCVFQQLMKFLPILVELKVMGVRISIDDFGAGYSTLSQFIQIPFDVLKIDKIFANRITTDQKDIAIISGLLDISDNLGMEVIGEGIETAEQLAVFQSEGCSIIQGFYFSQPVAGSEIPALLEKGMGHLLIGSGSG